MTPGETARAIGRLHASRRARRPADPIRALVALVVVAALAVAARMALGA